MDLNELLGHYKDFSYQIKTTSILFTKRQDVCLCYLLSNLP